MYTDPSFLNAKQPAEKLIYFEGPSQTKQMHKWWSMIEMYDLASCLTI